MFEGIKGRVSGRQLLALLLLAALLARAKEQHEKFAAWQKKKHKRAAAASAAEAETVLDGMVESFNAQDIAKRGAELFDKLSNFVADLQKVGGRLKEAQSAYDDAEKRLSTGKGNVIRQAQMLKEFGENVFQGKVIEVHLGTTSSLRT
jgi:DNA recombination protein RmuC